MGSDDLGDRAGEDGVGVGVAVCFDEWSNGGDDGVGKCRSHSFLTSSCRHLGTIWLQFVDTPYVVCSSVSPIDDSNFLQWRSGLREHLSLCQPRRLRAGVAF